MTDKTVFVVDDDVKLCDSIRFQLSVSGYRVETFHSAQQFLDAYDESQPGCVLLDVKMPGIPGDELQRRLVDAGTQATIVFMTANPEIEMAVSAVKTGATDYIEKPFDRNRLIECVERAFEVDEERREKTALLKDSQSRLEDLTPREREVLELVVQGKANKNIAAELGIAIKTVELHRSRVMKTTRAESVPDLVKIKLHAEGGSGEQA